MIASWHYLAQIPPEHILHTEDLVNFGLDADGGFCADRVCLPVGICEADVCALVLHATDAPNRIKLSQTNHPVICESGQVCIDMQDWSEKKVGCDNPTAIPVLRDDPCGRHEALCTIRDSIMACQEASSISGKGESIRFKGNDDWLEHEIRVAAYHCNKCRPCRRNSRSLTVHVGCSR